MLPYFSVYLLFVVFEAVSLGSSTLTVIHVFLTVFLKYKKQKKQETPSKKMKDQSTCSG
jgi:hypothetical protein